MSSALQKYINENKYKWYRDSVTEGKKEMALELISLGTVSIEDIAKCANLDIDEVKDLKVNGINNSKV